MATTFHPFPYLPWELRARIWELSAKHRVVHVGTVEYGKPLSDASVGKKQYKALFSLTPIPAMLQACRESRNLGVYRQSFSEVERVPGDLPSLRRYVWLNLDIDIIDIGMQDLRDLKLVAPSIKRLMLERATFDYYDKGALLLFENLKEVHVVCPTRSSLVVNGFNLWFYAGYDRPLDTKHIILIDKVNDRVMTLFELNWEAEERLREAVVHNDSDSSD